MKPSWDDAPKWANWLAMDECGNWWFYEKKPVWHENSKSWLEESEDGRIKEASLVQRAENSLESRP